MKIYFSHGKESGPNGTKIQKLTKIAEKMGFNVESIDYTEILNPDNRVEHLLKILKKEKEDFILVGSSMGGYVSLVVSEKTNPKGIFLLAPALYMKGYKKQHYKSNHNIAIVHGWNDTIIPPENSIKFAKSIACPLHLIPGNHRLTSSINTIEKIFSQFLECFVKINE